MFKLLPAKALLIILIGLLSSTAIAQTTPSPTPPRPRPAAGYSTQGRNDTLQAVSHLFGRRRRGGTVWLIFSGLGALTALRAAAGTTTNTVAGPITSRPNAAGVAIIFAVYAGIPGGIGAGKLSRFSMTNENEVLSNYRSGQPLPREISRRLRRKDF